MRCGVLLAALTLAVVASGPALGDEQERDSYLAKAYWRIPSFGKPHFGIAVERDHEVRSRPPARNFEPLWQKPRLLDLHFDGRDLAPTALNGFDLTGSPTAAPDAADERGWTSTVR